MLAVMIRILLLVGLLKLLLATGRWLLCAIIYAVLTLTAQRDESYSLRF